ncbi:hypothetical protein BDV26DRAFT_255360 [Aspergillus bertholletiae]|uniref:BZIP domain-containing protein n=1 Tax=Aspergillus bertholletiae TaxID=1226010 RepID=A0A5N7BIG1_9EURO|nr:hypothetical protein BDV26DRAFT_255360 [Aspergillus bertholletiae]
MTKKASDQGAQKAKKRAWDRAAQRASRQKTKARIEHLQQTIQALQKQIPEDTVLRLLRENDQLRAQNLRLNRIIVKASSILSGDESVPRSPLATDDHRAIPETDLLPTSSSEESAVPYSSPGPLNSRTWNMPLTEELGLHQVCSAIDNIAKCDRQIKCKCQIFQGRIIFRSPLYISLAPPMIAGKFHGVEDDKQGGVVCDNAISYQCNCAAWFTVNEFLSKAYPTLTSKNSGTWFDDSKLLFKAISYGWDCLGPEEQISPTLDILRQMDKYVWSTMPKIYRLAIAYKSYHLMEYIFNPGPDSRHNVPEWELPTLLQMTVQHPCAIDFFPWPPVRDCLIVNYAHYLKSCNFFSCIHRCFHFHWPYSFEESYVVDDVFGYTPSPLFLLHVENLSNWRMRSDFFHHFPELAGLIPEAKAEQPNK